MRSLTRTPLIDGQGRVHRDLRISVTDVCNLRCAYCLPAEGVPWLAAESLLTREEIVRVARVAAERGIESVRLTGGEPLLRRDLVGIVADLAALQGPHGPLKLSLTTNAVGLDKVAAALKEAGLRRANISLDTLDPQRFAQLTRRDRFDRVMAGIDAADAVGLAPLKINTVLMRGVNEDEAVDMVRWAHDRGFEPRFIEQMPLDAGHEWARREMVTAEETLRRLAQHVDLVPLPGRGAAPAERFEVNGGPGVVGIIASVTKPFCGACDRIRLTADGQVRNCLFARTETDVRGALRGGADDDDVARLLGVSVAAKAPGHGIDSPGFEQPDRPMSAIGG